jgi:hypothetical protein
MEFTFVETDSAIYYNDSGLTLKSNMLAHWKQTMLGGRIRFHDSAKNSCTRMRAVPTRSNPSSRDIMDPCPPLPQQQPDEEDE